MALSEGDVKFRKIPGIPDRTLYSNISYWPLTTRKRTCPPFITSPVFYVSLVCLLCAFAIGLCFVFLRDGYRYDANTLEYKQCPACFGQSACPAFFRGDVKVPFVFRMDLDHLDMMPVYFEPYSKVRSFLHGLQYPATSQAVDAAVCRRGKRAGSAKAPVSLLNSLKCVPHLSIWRWVPTSSPEAGAPLEAYMLTAEPGESTSTSASTDGAKFSPVGFAPFVRCVSPRLLSLIRERFRERTSFRAPTRWLRFDELTLLFNLAINPHAVVIQTFPVSSGWPFSEYVGACGRLVVERYSGEPLSHFRSSPRRQRLEIIRSLLTLPARLQKSSGVSIDSAFALYLADFGWDNFVVNPISHVVSVAQARHIIAVDLQRSLELNSSMHVVSASAKELAVQTLRNSTCLGYVSETGDSGGPTPVCLSASHADALCSHPSSDHNFWAVCLTITHGGDSPDRINGSVDFLDGLPPLLIKLFHKCLDDSETGARQSHIQAAINLIENELDKGN